MTTIEADFDAQAFRRVLGQFATGVTVITVQRGDDVHGMTANAFSSVSLDPPLVLFCVTKTARMAGYIQQVEGFGISFLSEDQQDVSRQFAGTKIEDIRNPMTLQRGPVAPLIDGALASLSCLVEEIHPAGDHDIVIGRVVAVTESASDPPPEPLLFFRSRYQRLAPQAPGAPEPIDAWSNDAIRLYHEEWSEGDFEQLDWRVPW